MDPNWRFGVGAIWIYALERPIRADIAIFRNRIEDARCEAVQLLGPQPIDGVRVEDLRIAGPLTSVVALPTSTTLVPLFRVKSIVSPSSAAPPAVSVAVRVATSP